MRIPRRSFFVKFRNARQKWQTCRYATGSLPSFETTTKEEQGTTHQFAICGEIMNTDKAQSIPDFETEINFGLHTLATNRNRLSLEYCHDIR